MNPYAKMGIIVALMVAVGAIVVIKHGGMPSCCPPSAASQTEMPPAPAVPATGDVRQYEPSTLPRLVDLGAGKCIPCKMMAPILEQLKTEYQGKLDVIFIDVWENPGADKPYNINLIPTQIFIAPTGAELFRHEGFFSKEDILAKWKELGFDFAVAATPQFSRLEPASPDTRPKDQICYMCEKDIAAKTLVVVKTDKGDVRLCGPHCYFIMYSCLTEDKTDFEKKVTVADFASGRMLPLSEAIYLQGVDAAGRPTLQAYADTAAAKQAQQTAGGNILSFSALQTNELSHRCGFCDRACYPQDAAEVRLEGVQTWGCCSHCALGVAARTGKDIEVREKDRLTGEPIVVKTLNGSIASLEPSTAVAWFGQRKKPDGTWTSAGCFHQGFFVNADNLRKWVEKNPHETGKLITIHQALADKMKLSPEQIQKACKIGECAPK